MPRSGGGVYSLPPGTDDMVPNTTIQSSVMDSLTADLEAAFNTAWPTSIGIGAAGVLGSWDSLAAKGTDVATASTIDMTVVTAPVVNLTGTTTVTAITSADGNVRIARAASGFNFTASANLVVNGSGSGTVSVGADTLMLIKGGAGGKTYVATLGSASAFPDQSSITWTYTDAGAAVGPTFDMYRLSSSPATNDILASIVSNGRDSAGNKQEYAAVETVIVDATSTTERGTIDWYTMQNGSRNRSMSIGASGTATTATAAGTTTLTKLSAAVQKFTGTSTQTVVLPVVAELFIGQPYTVINLSTGNVTVQSSGANTITVMPGGSQATFSANANSGTGASVWDFKYTGLPAAGGLVYLTSGTVSNAATLDIVLTSYTAYRGIVIMLSSLVAVTDNTTLLMRFSTNGGSSYDAGASDYGWAYNRTGNGTNTPGGSETATSINVAGNVGNAQSTDGVNMTITLQDPFNTALHTKASFIGATSDINSTFGAYYGGGQRNTAQDTDAVRFLMSSGNISSGSYAVYGYV